MLRLHKVAIIFCHCLRWASCHAYVILRSRLKHIPINLVNFIRELIYLSTLRLNSLILSSDYHQKSLNAVMRGKFIL